MRMSYEKLEMKILRQLQCLQYPFMPKTSPTFIHDLGFDLRNEIPGLFVHNREQILFPIGQMRIMIADKNQQIFLRVKRNFVQIRRNIILAPMDGAKRVGRRLRLLEFAFYLLLGG